MYCYPVVLGRFTIWLPRFDSHRAQQSSHFFIAQEIICSWPTAAVLFHWQVSIASCRLVSSRWNGAADLPPGSRDINCFPTDRLSGRWYQIGEISLIFLHSQWFQDSGRNKESPWKRIHNPPTAEKAEHSSLALASFPEELCMTTLPAGLLVWSAQHLSHLLSNLKHIWQRGREETFPASSMNTGMGRAEVTCQRSLQRCHSGRVLSVSPLLTSNQRTHTRGTPGTSPPNQHKMSMHREQEHWHCLNKHTHHVVLRGVRGFLDILIL